MHPSPYLLDDALSQDGIALTDWRVPRTAKPAEEVPSALIHGVHTACQIGAEFFTTWCGQAVTSAGKATATEGAPGGCPDCDRTRQCRACGLTFEYTMTELLAWLKATS